MIEVIAFLFWFFWMSREATATVITHNNDFFIYRIFVSFGAVFALVVIPLVLGRREFRILRNKVHFAIAAYVFWAGLSIAWAVTSQRLSALGLWCGMLGELIAIVLIMSVQSRRPAVIQASLFGMIAGACWFTLASLMLVERSNELRPGTEHLIQPNMLGDRIAIGALCAFFAFVIEKQRSRKLLLLLLFTLLCGGLVLSTSKTAIIAFSCALGCYMLFSRTAKRSTKFLILSTVGVAVLVTLPLSMPYFQNYLYSDADLSLTGRIPIWYYVVSHLQWKSVLFGYGFMAFYENSPPFYPTTHAHNEVLQQLASLGVIGLLLAVVIYVVYLRYVCTRRNPLRELAMVWLGYALVRGLTEAVAGGLVLPLPLVLFLSYGVARGTSSAMLQRKSVSTFVDQQI